MERLQTDYVDLYYLHRVNPDIPVEEVAQGMGRLIEEGLIRGWGMSMVNVPLLERVQSIAPLSAVQNIYSMMDRAYEKEVIPYCQKHNIGLWPSPPLPADTFPARWTPTRPFPAMTCAVGSSAEKGKHAGQPASAEVLSDMAARKHATNAQISLAWMLRKYPHVVPIPGSKNKGRILENLGAWEVSLSDGEFQELEEALGRIAHPRPAQRPEKQDRVY